MIDMTRNIRGFKGYARVRKLLVILSLLAASGAVHAAAEVSGYEQTKKAGGAAWDTMQIYVYGIGNGLLWANAWLETKNQPLIYCTPKTLALTKDNYLQILDSYIQKHSPNPSDDIGALLETGLRETFPCDKK